MKDWLGRIVDLQTNSGITITGYFVKPKENVWFTGKMDIVDYRTIAQKEKRGGFSLNGMLGNSVIQIDDAAFGNVIIADHHSAHVDIFPSEILIGTKFNPASILSFSFALPELDNFFFQHLTNMAQYISNPSQGIHLEPMISSKLTEDDSTVRVVLERLYQFNDSRSFFTVRSDNRIYVEPNIKFEINDIIRFVACAIHFFSFILMEHVNLPSKVAILLRNDGDDRPQSTQLLLNDNRRYYTQHKDEPAKIQFSAIEKSLGLIWSNWIQFWDNKENQPLIKLYSDVISHKSVGSNRYLNICHALEYYSRIYRTKEVEEVNKEKGTNGIPLFIRFIDMLRMTNDYFDLSEEEIESKSRELANKRNYLSHYNFRNSKQVADIDHFSETRVEYDLENFAFCLFMVVVYSELKIPAKVIKNALERSENTFASTLENIFDGPREEERLF